ncbi:MAG: PKD domain-containing protein [Candidatus Wallbacteria bacterium]|nr:PKD domain-containing protein [Candidatus Wallbacteria bacterium]
MLGRVPLAVDFSGVALDPDRHIGRYEYRFDSALLADDVETAGTAFVPDAGWARTAEAASGSYSWTCSLKSGYGLDSSLTSREVAVSGPASLLLSLAHKYRSSYYGREQIELSENGGGWQSLATFGGASALASQDQFVSTTVSVPVTPSTTSIRIRFRLSSPYYGSSAEWSVDNLALQPAGAPADFTSATTMATRHTYAAAGDYYPLLTLTDDAGVSASWPAHVRVLAADEPLAVASATPASGRTPLTVRLSSAGSSGGSGPITRYQWFLDRGVFFDDMESGPAKWVSQPPWALTSETATGGRWSWSDSPNGNYANSVNSSLTSIPFDLPAQPVRSTLSFWHRYVTESCCDRCYVELSTDGGGTWQQLRDEAGNYIAYGGSQSQFTRASIPLSPYAGTRGARIRFRFTSDSSVTYDGWHIDDVRIATDPVTAAIPDYDSVSTGDTTIQYDIPGRYSPRLRLTGSGGLTAEAATSVTVATTTGTPVGETLPVSLYANTSGYAPPVQTQFTANVTSTGHRVIRYDWDFDGDGVVDAFTTDTNTTRFGYIRPGPVRASVRVLDDAGNSGTASTQFNISFSTPSVSLATDRTSLSLGQTVTFVPSVSASGTVTSFAWSFGPSGATYSGAGTPVTTAFRFASQGYYYATLRVSDEFGGGGSAGISLQVVGTDYPTVTLTPSTTQGATPLDVVFTVGVTPGDGSGSNLVRYDWDFDGVPADNRTLTTSAPQTFHYTRDGVFQPRVTVTDAWNRAMSARTRLTFGTPPVSQPSAAPVAGQAPLTVVFQCAGRASSGSLVLYDWDFLGHGVFPGVLSAWSADVSNATQTWIGKPLVYTYSEPGVYDATLRVTDRNGLQGTGKVRISVGPRASAAALIAQPPVGAAPLTVQFTAGLTAGRRVLGYQFDATGNGPFSLTTSSNSFEATYPAPGDYHPRVLVRSEGAADATSECTLHVRAANGPAATLQAENTSGSAPLDVTFHGSGVSTYGIAARYDWDFDGDGTFEYSSRSASSVIHTYAEAGAYTPTLRVTDLLGRTDRASITVKASPGLVVQRETESFDPQQGESLSVDSALSSTTSVRLRIVDRFHQAVRTLLPFTVRGPGPHVDHWDGKDDLGRLVGGGVYYYILDYAVSGVTGTLDSSGQAPTFRYFYPSSEQTFDPFANKPLTVRYTLSRSAEVSIYVFSSGGAGNQTIARTVLLREPQTTGQYVVAWDGALDDGNVAGSLQSGGSSVAYVMPAYISDLPDNALIVAGRPLLSDVSSDPPLFTPDNPYQASGGLFSSIHFWLSKASSITAQVQSPTGQIVRTFTQRDLIRGPQSVRWDGRTDAGGLAHLGLYRIGLEATDSTGLKSPRQTSVVKVAY